MVGGRRNRKARPRGPEKPLTREEITRKLQGIKKLASPGENYRERSLAIHGLICAKCAREFDWTNRHQLTVHHIDGNDKNNPPDGSNWENLCVDCHEDEHSRGRLGDYFRGD
ncbi:MAG: YajD family HNH nuclease [Candidatus Krumholzibacteriia bacterium]